MCVRVCVLFIGLWRAEKIDCAVTQPFVDMVASLYPLLSTLLFSSSLSLTASLETAVVVGTWCAATKVLSALSSISSLSLLPLSSTRAQGRTLVGLVVELPQGKLVEEEERSRRHGAHCGEPAGGREHTQKRGEGERIERRKKRDGLSERGLKG